MDLYNKQKNDVYSVTWRMTGLKKVNFKRVKIFKLRFENSVYVCGTYGFELVNYLSVHRLYTWNRNCPSSEQFPLRQKNMIVFSTANDQNKAQEISQQ